MLSRFITGQVEKFLISYSLTVFVTAFQVLKIVFERFDSVAVYKISDFLFFKGRGNSFRSLSYCHALTSSQRFFLYLRP